MKQKLITFAFTLMTLAMTCMPGYAKAQTMNDIVEEAVQGLKEQCPMDYGGITMTDIDVQMDYLIMYMDVPFTSDIVAPELFKEMLREEMISSYAAEDMSIFADMLIVCDMGLECYITLEDGEKTIVLFTPREFAELIAAEREAMAQGF